MWDLAVWIGGEYKSRSQSIINSNNFILRSKKGHILQIDKLQAIKLYTVCKVRNAEILQHRMTWLQATVETKRKITYSSKFLSTGSLKGCFLRELEWSFNRQHAIRIIPHSRNSSEEFLSLPEVKRIEI